MKHILAALLVIIALEVVGVAQSVDSCGNFQALVQTTYRFKPSTLLDSERESKVSAMDKVWNLAKERRAELLPCLRALLEDSNTDPWFRFDGSNLLVELDPSRESKVIQVRHYTNVDLRDIDPQVWVETLARRGSEGLNVSEAGSRLLSSSEANYSLPAHGAYQVGALQGALFIFGSMDESEAMPALVKIVRQANHPGRENALRILMSQATPESLRALTQIDASGFSKDAQKDLQSLLKRPALLTRRTKPKTSRAEFLQAFQDIVDNKWDKFFHLVEKVPDGEKDAVAVLKPEDLALVRRVRRIVISRANPHALEYYDTFTAIIMTIIWKPELVNGRNPSPIA